MLAAIVINPIFDIVGLVLLGIGIWAVVDVFRRPAWVWAAAGQNKTTWSVLSIVGLLICNIIGLVYILAIRPRLNAAQNAGGPVGGFGGGPYGGPGPGPYGAPPYGGPGTGGAYGAGQYGAPGAGGAYGADQYGTGQYGTPPTGGQYGPGQYGAPATPPPPPPAGSPPPGWYPDPAGSGQPRYWNGETWGGDGPPA